MLSTAVFAAYLDQLLLPQAIKDYCPNGLQIAGCKTIHRLITGVSANMAFIKEAVHKNADALLVHHGLFWQGDAYPLVGLKGARVKAIMQADMNLFAYHLPLDIHSKYGNNVQLAELLSIQIKGTFPSDETTPLGLWGDLTAPCPGQEFAKQIEQALGQSPIHIQTHSRPLTRVAWCTGAAQDYILQASLLGVDAFITGEISERTPAFAQELGIDFFAAGHHATERGGVIALGEHLAQQFGLTVEFIDIENSI